jgi:hypothetical protein
MSKRKADDAEIQRIVRFYRFPTQEVALIKDTKKWSEDDFLYALERVETDLPELSSEERNQIRSLYRNLRVERASEEANARRHDEIFRQLEELKKPHWSIIPNFWVTVAILILTAIGVLLTAILAIAGFLPLRH